MDNDGKTPLGQIIAILAGIGLVISLLSSLVLDIQIFSLLF